MFFFYYVIILGYTWDTHGIKVILRNGLGDSSLNPE